MSAVPSCVFSDLTWSWFLIQSVLAVALFSFRVLRSFVFSQPTSATNCCKSVRVVSAEGSGFDRSSIFEAFRMFHQRGIGINIIVGGNSLVGVV